MIPLAKNNPPVTQEVKRLYAEANKNERRFREAFTSLIEDNSPETLQQEDFSVLTEAFVAAAAAGAALLLRQANIDEEPVGLRQRTIENYEQSVVAPIATGTLAALTAVPNPALAFGLTPNQAQAVDNYRHALEEGDRTIDRELRDRRFDPTARRATREPLTQSQIDRMTERYRERYVRQRAQNIGRTEALRAVQTGLHRELEERIARGDIDPRRVKRYWRHQGDGRVRHSHIQIPLMNPNGREPGEDFRSPLGPISFPGDPDATPGNVINCRCAVFVRLDETPR